MSLSCTCHDVDLEGASWIWYQPEDFSNAATAKRTRCRSCGLYIAPGEECVEVQRVRGPRNEYEERRFGDEIALAPYRFCAQCGEILLNLIAYGYCVDIQEPMKDQLLEHWERTGFDKRKYAEARL